MPVAIRRSPFGATTDQPQPDVPTLRTPQARVLAALMPDRPDSKPINWPMYNRAQLGVRAGYTAISGTVTRALNGVREGSSSGEAHLGLLALKLIEEEELDIEGVRETCYRITPAGIAAYSGYVAAAGGLPPLKDVATCTNNRYRSRDNASSEVSPAQ